MAFYGSYVPTEPNGQKWIDIYNSIVPTEYDVRELAAGAYDDQYDAEAWDKRVNG